MMTSNIFLFQLLGIHLSLSSFLGTEEKGKIVSLVKRTCVHRGFNICRFSVVIAHNDVRAVC